MRTWYAIKNEGTGPVKISIHEEIGAWGISARDFLSEFSAIEPGRKVALSIQSPGGDVADGLAIYNAVKRHGDVHVRIEGLAASMASVVAMGARTVTMPKNSYLMIHNPWTLAAGDAEGLAGVAETLGNMENMLAGIYADKTKRPFADIKAMMAKETWLSAEEAIELGFADDIEAELKVAATFDASRFFMGAPAALEISEEETVETPAVIEPVVDPVPDAPVEPVVEVASAETEEETPVIEAPAEPVGVFGRFAQFFRSLSGPVTLDADSAVQFQAKITALESELVEARAKIANFEKEEREISALLTELEKAKASRAREIADAVASLGFPTASVPQLPAVGNADPKPTLLEQFQALKGPEARAFWNANKEELTKALERKA
jgi:ATP-dependent protease ClpP protease subunit